MFQDGKVALVAEATFGKCGLGRIEWFGAHLAIGGNGAGGTGVGVEG